MRERRKRERARERKEQQSRRRVPATNCACGGGEEKRSEALHRTPPPSHTHRTIQNTATHPSIGEGNVGIGTVFRNEGRFASVQSTHCRIHAISSFGNFVNSSTSRAYIDRVGKYSCTQCIIVQVVKRERERERGRENSRKSKHDHKYF